MIEYITNGDITVLQKQAVIILLCWGVMVAAVIIDLWTGIDKAKSKNEEIHSKALRMTITKIGEYWRVLVMALLFDIVASFIIAYNLPYGSMIGSICIIAIELRSMLENLKAKKSSAADMPDMLLKIIKCSDTNSAKKLVDYIIKNNENANK